MAIFNKVANIMAGLSLASSAIEIGERGMKKANAYAKTEVAIKDIKNITGDRKLNMPSNKHKEMKDFIRSNDTFTPLYKIKGGISGFCSGAYEVIKNNLPSIGFATMTLVVKNRTLKTIGVIGCGISMAWDFIRNGTNLFTERDTIEK